MNTTGFGESVKEYLRTSGYTQKELADQIGLHKAVLSRKLNQSGRAFLTHLEIHRIIITLAHWRAISTQEEAIHLLELAQMGPNYFGSEEWLRPPLNQLITKHTYSTALNSVQTPEPILPQNVKADSLPATGSGTLIFGSVQGFVHGDNNRVTLIFPDHMERSIPFLAPPRPPYNLVGRDMLIRKLREHLIQKGNLALSALNGLPGVGKTALAVALSYDHEVLGHFCDGVLWAGLGRESDVFTHLGKWGLALGISQSDVEKQTSLSSLAQIIHNAIGSRRMLLVIDDAWSTEAALAYKVGGPHCAHLVTTRLPEVAEFFAVNGTIVVRELGEDEGQILLERLAPGLIESSPDEVRELVQLVGGLPLPLTLIGNYLRVQMNTGQSRRLRSALDRLHQVEERLRLSQPQVGIERHPSLPEGVPLSLLEVIKISDEALDEETRQVLRSLAAFPSKPNTFSEQAALAVAETSIKPIDTLLDLGLLESSGEERYTLHQTISDYAKSQLTDLLVYERMVEYYINYVEHHKNDRGMLEQESSNILASVQIVFERELHPKGLSTFAHFIQILRRSRAL
jgi:hypothetical protein